MKIEKPYQRAVGVGLGLGVILVFWLGTRYQTANALVLALTVGIAITLTGLWHLAKGGKDASFMLFVFLYVTLVLIWTCLVDTLADFQINMGYAGLERLSHRWARFLLPWPLLLAPCFMTRPVRSPLIIDGFVLAVLYVFVLAAFGIDQPACFFIFSGYGLLAVPAIICAWGMAAFECFRVPRFVAVPMFGVLLFLLLGMFLPAT